MKIMMIIMLCGLILGLAAYVWMSGREDAIVEVPDNAAAGDLLLSPYKYKIGKKQYNAEKGVLVVKENWEKAESRLIALPVIRIFSLSRTPKAPIFWLDGGPGNSNMNYVPGESLLKNHDFILVGYRGVDGSCRLDAPAMEEALKGDGIDLAGEASINGFKKAAAQTAADYIKAGIDIAGYTIPGILSDMETARKKMGYEKINLLSASFGTRVALLYAQEHPQSIHRSVMVSVNPPGRFLWYPDMIDQQLTYYSELYDKQATEKQTDNLAGAVKKALRDMPSHWGFFRLDKSKIKTGTLFLLFHRNTAAMAFDSYIAAAKGDYRGLYLIQTAYDFMIPNSMVYGQFTAMGLIDFDLHTDYKNEFQPPDPILGNGFVILYEGTKAWPRQGLPQRLRDIHDSEVETLLVSGNIDFSTPAQYATRDLLPHLKNGKQVILKEMGHVGDILKLQPQATEHLLATYFNSGEVDDSLYQYAPMNFTPQFRFTTIVTVIIWSLVGIPIIVAAAIYLKIRKARKKKNKV